MTILDSGLLFRPSSISSYANDFSLCSQTVVYGNINASQNALFVNNLNITIAKFPHFYSVLFT